VVPEQEDPNDGHPKRSDDIELVSDLHLIEVSPPIHRLAPWPLVDAGEKATIHHITMSESAFREPAKILANIA
jgi:hypothetical protein